MMDFIYSLWPNFILGCIAGMTGPKVLNGTADAWTVAALTVSVALLAIHHIRAHIERERKLDEICREVLGKSWDEVTKAKKHKRVL